MYLNFTGIDIEAVAALRTAKALLVTETISISFFVMLDLKSESVVYYV